MPRLELSPQKPFVADRHADLSPPYLFNLVHWLATQHGQSLRLTGLAFLIQNNIAKIILSLIGIILMLKLAWDAFKDARHGKGLDVSASASAHGDFASGAFLSLGNPLNIVFWTGLGTTVFASIAGGPQPIHFAIFFAGFLAGAILWCFFMAGLVAWGKQWMTPNFFRWVNLTCGIVLIYFAVQLGVQTVQSLI